VYGQKTNLNWGGAFQRGEAPTNEVQREKAKERACRRRYSKKESILQRGESRGPILSIGYEKVVNGSAEEGL